jgi:hypothetical protein
VTGVSGAGGSPRLSHGTAGEQPSLRYTVGKVTSALSRRLGSLLLVVGTACGVPAPDIAVAGACTLDGVPVQLEQGVRTGSSVDHSCHRVAHVLGQYRDTFIESWGDVTLRGEGWMLRVRAGGSVDSEGHTGVTYHHARVVDVAETGLETFPHELRHVQLGKSSDDHHGWCSTFAPWEERVLGVDERAYLGCPR